MINTNYWVEANRSFYDCNTGNQIVWTRRYDEDLYQMSKSFLLAAYYATEEIVNEEYDNTKYDMWFLPCVYMFRQGIELILKALVFRVIGKRHEFELALIEDKHNLTKLWDRYRQNTKSFTLSINEQKWISRYLDEIEKVDKNSTLFRYPFKDDFLQQYKDDFLDVCEMGNSLLNAYAILDKEYKRVDDELIYEIDVNRNDCFLLFSSNGMGNCQLWDSPWGDGFHKQVEGYSEVAEFLYEKYKQDGNEDYVFPMLFLLRNAIELSLKRLLYAKVINGVEEKWRRKTRNSHSLEELWNAVNVMLRNYANQHGEDLQYLDYLEKCLKEFDAVDKNGDVFRYPFDYNLTYRFHGQLIDVDNVFSFMAGVFNILDGCSSMLSCIADNEAEMLYELQSYMC